MKEYIEPINIKNTKPGLTYKYYEGNWQTIPNFKLLNPKKKGVISKFEISPKERTDDFAITYDGYIDLPSDGIYTFYFRSDDGLRFYINDNLLHEALGRHGMEIYNESIGLKKGKHKLYVEYNEIDGGEGLDISIEGGGLIKQEIKNNLLSYWNIIKVYNYIPNWCKSSGERGLPEATSLKIRS